MRLLEILGNVRDLLFRMLPHRYPTGIVKVGRPTRSSPVVATGNFALTVRRIRRTLSGRDVWLLVTNSRGVNVWCAAGGGHLTHHDFVAAIRASNVAGLVDHRTLIVPQLCATGVERRHITDATGWNVRWGPADMADLPAYLDRGCRVRRRERSVSFPLRRRIEMASIWVFWMGSLTAAIVAIAAGWRLAIAATAALALEVMTLYALTPRLRIAGHARWATFAIFAAAGASIGFGLLFAAGDRGAADLIAAAAIPAAMMLLVGLDFAGTTPLFPSDINTAGGAPHIELDVDRCTGAADCVQVCPRDVLAMNGRRRRVEIVRTEQCIACGACIVQCPTDALHFRYDDGRVIGPDVIRTTRLNLLGQRAVHVD